MASDTLMFGIPLKWIKDNTEDVYVTSMPPSWMVFSALRYDRVAEPISVNRPLPFIHSNYMDITF